MAGSPKAIVILLFVVFALFVLPQGATAQEKTAATDPAGFIKKKKAGPKKQRPLYVVKNNTRKILYGNRCFLDVQRSMGFEYLVQLKGQPLNRNEIGRNMHNFGIKVVLCFKNGPFWKLKLNKKKKECRKLSGDFVG